jgi:serine/threonine-protein kinase ATR
MKQNNERGRFRSGAVLSHCPAWETKPDLKRLRIYAGKKTESMVRAISHLSLQLLSVIKFHNKSPYILLSPYLDKIAPLLVSRVCTQPELLQETCRLISITQAEFITINLRRTLPHLFGNCESKVLETISRDLGKTPSALFLDYSANILAHIFRLQAPGQTNKALAFVAKILSDAAGHGSIDAANVVKSSGLPLLAELVVGMGDEGSKADSVGYLIFIFALL